jgi:hypothetical protein
MTLSVNSNGVIQAPSGWKAANDIASATNLAAAWAEIITNAVAFNSFSNSASARLTSLEGATNSATFSYALQGTGAVTWVATQSWDFASASNGTDWTYAYGATWITNYGAKLYGPPWQWDDLTNNQIQFAQAQTSYMYRVTWTQQKSPDGYNPSSVKFWPGGVQYMSPTNLTTNTVIVTNTSQIVLSIYQYYAPTYIRSITIEEANPPYVTPVRGSLEFDYSNRWDIGTAAAPAASIYATEYPLLWLIVTNADVTTYTPRRVGDMMLDVGSNCFYLSYGLTTNDWQ